jgi:menaquinone-9 beta-reductase
VNVATAHSPADVLVVGAGPAGLASAIAAARQGLHVEVIDAMKPPIDKACGEGLMPDALATLAGFGLDLSRDLPQSESAPLRGIRFIGQPQAADSQAPTPDTVTEAAFLNGFGRGVRRTALHQLLLDHAAALGVRFHWETVVQGLSQSNGLARLRTNQRPFDARYLVGADGHQSHIAKWANLTQATSYSTRIGLRQHYFVRPWTDFVEVYWSNRGQAYVTPISSDQVCIAFIATKRFSSPADALAHFPGLSRHLESAVPSGPPRGAVTFCSSLHRVTSGNVAVVGDASGSVDAITGEGMALCFRQAAALAPALQSDNLASYQAAHRNIQRIPCLMSRILLLIGRSTRLRARIFSTFEHNPALFSSILQLHVGNHSLNIFGEDGLLAAGLNLLTS